MVLEHLSRGLRNKERKLIAKTQGKAGKGTVPLPEGAQRARGTQEGSMSLQRGGPMGQRSEWREPIATPITPTEQGHMARFVPGEGLMDCLFSSSLFLCINEKDK